jgi:hypothetical protein
VVSMVSIKVAVLYMGSYLVGVVIVVYRLFSVRKLWNLCCGERLSRLMLMSPMMVISEEGDFVWMLLMVVCKSVMKWSMFFRGR